MGIVKMLYLSKLKCRAMSIIKDNFYNLSLKIPLSIRLKLFLLYLSLDTLFVYQPKGNVHAIIIRHQCSCHAFHQTSSLSIGLGVFLLQYSCKPDIRQPFSLTNIPHHTLPVVLLAAVLGGFVSLIHRTATPGRQSVAL